MEKRLFLRAFEYGDLKKLNALRNDDDANQFTAGNKFFISSEYDRKWIEDKIFNNVNQIYVAICLMRTKELIGYMGVSNIDYRNGKAQWAGINIEKKHSNKGYGFEAVRLLLQFVFEELRINRFWVHISVKNIPSLRIAEKAGFKKEGLVRDYVYKRNKYHDVYLLSILKAEYEKLYGKLK